MTLHQLKIFECVARHMNITKASQALHISQPSVSQQLNFWSRSSEHNSCLRLNHGVELTAQGREYRRRQTGVCRKPQTSRTRSGVFRVQTRRAR